MPYLVVSYERYEGASTEEFETAKEVNTYLNKVKKQIAQPQSIVVYEIVGEVTAAEIKKRSRKHVSK